MVSPAFPGLFFCFAAVALLVFASVSPPAWDKVNFLSANVGGSNTLYGVFGKCVSGGACSSRSVGYNILPNGQDFSYPGVLHNLTYTLILHPIAGGFAFFAMLFGLLGVVAASRFLTILMAVTAFLGAIVCLVVFVIDMVLWNILKHKVQDAGGVASLGNANWLTIGAFAALCLASCSACLGAFGRFASGRSAGEKY